MATKKVRVKVKKKKLNIKRIVICLLTIIILYYVISYLITLPARSIIINGNSNVSDQEILEIANLDNHPSFFLSTSYQIKKKLKSNPYIEEVKVTKKMGYKIYLDITEYKILSLYNNQLLLSNGELIDNNYNLSDIPILLSDITAVKDRYVKKMALVDKDILREISEIEYLPNDVDKERFLLYMNDGNSIYITLSKIKKLNKYPSIVYELDGKKGIIYLDSGDYVEVKE